MGTWGSWRPLTYHSPLRALRAESVPWTRPVPIMWCLNSDLAWSSHHRRSSGQPPPYPYPPYPTPRLCAIISAPMLYSPAPRLGAGPAPSHLRGGERGPEQDGGEPEPHRKPPRGHHPLRRKVPEGKPRVPSEEGGDRLGRGGPCELSANQGLSRFFQGFTLSPASDVSVGAPPPGSSGC